MLSGLATSPMTHAGNMREKPLQLSHRHFHKGTCHIHCSDQCLANFIGRGVNLKLTRDVLHQCPAEQSLLVQLELRSTQVDPSNVCEGKVVL